MRLFLLTLLASAAVSSAQAATLLYECQRYRSPCTGEKCYHIASQLGLDTGRTLLTKVPVQHLNYIIDNMQAREQIEHNTTDITLYTQIDIQDNFIILSNVDASGKPFARASINKQNGVYSHYLIHNDGSIRDVPVGTPYRAYFGWCDKKEVSVQ